MWEVGIVAKLGYYGMLCDENFFVWVSGYFRKFGQFENSDDLNNS